MTFDRQPHLTSDTVSLAPLQRADFDALFEAARDPDIWVQHPVPNRYQRDVFAPYFETLLAAGGTLAIRETPSARVIGCSQFYVPDDHPEAIAIGYTFLACDHWGGETNWEVKRLMIPHALAVFPFVLFHIAADNLRSQIATKRLGAVFDVMLDDGAGRMVFKLTRDAWTKTLAARSTT